MFTTDPIMQPEDDPMQVLVARKSRPRGRRTEPIHTSTELLRKLT
jgi:hypothetical protein